MALGPHSLGESLQPWKRCSKLISYEVEEASFLYFMKVTFKELDFMNEQLNRCFHLTFCMLTFFLELTKVSVIEWLLNSSGKIQWISKAHLSLPISVSRVFRLCCLIAVGCRCRSYLSSGLFQFSQILCQLSFFKYFGDNIRPLHTWK